MSKHWVNLLTLVPSLRMPSKMLWCGQLFPQWLMGTVPSLTSFAFLGQLPFQEESIFFYRSPQNKIIMTNTVVDVSNYCKNYNSFTEENLIFTIHIVVPAKKTNNAKLCLIKMTQALGKAAAKWVSNEDNAQSTGSFSSVLQTPTLTAPDSPWELQRNRFAT